MERVAFKMKLFEGCVEEYKKRHEAIWPELVALLKEAGIKNYSIFLDEKEGNLFGVLQVENKERLGELPRTAIMQKWWAYMSDIMEANEDHSPVSIPLKELFYLA